MLVSDINTAWPGEEMKDVGARDDREEEEEEMVATDNGGDVVFLTGGLYPVTFC